MAIGLGQMIGFKLPENFNHPYTSRSITDFWRRWHMTLTAWFRNYVFIPLEYKRRHAKLLRQPTHILIVFALTGFWHAASWNFIIWGIYYGIILSLEVLGLGKFLKRLPAIIQHGYTLGIIFIGWVFFRLTAISDWPGFFKTLFGMNGFSGIYTSRSLNILAYWPVLAAAMVFCLPLDQWIPESTMNSGIWRIASQATAIGLLFLSIALLVSRGYQSFLYAQF
jgi:alginate O-acetyltransferase complex protein AlgI